MKHLVPLALLVTAVCALPCNAQAQGQLAYAARTVNVRAGPAQDYPIVAVLPAGFQLAVQGCLPDYAWCDVIAGPSRGWVYGGNINYAYQNTYVPVLDYGAIIGIGVVAFVLNDYWGHHYRNRSWYRDRQRWINRPAPAPRFHAPPTGQRFSGPAPRPRFNGPPPGAVGERPRPRAGATHRPDPNPSGAVIPGQQAAAPQPSARPPRQQHQRAAPDAPPQGGGSGWPPRQSRGQGRQAAEQ